MYESSGELPQVSRESKEINEEAKQKLNKLPADEIVDPSVLGITPERAENIHQEFEKRIRAETDIEKVVDGIIPSEALFNPDMPLQSIATSSGLVEIKRRGRVSRAVINTLLWFIKLPEAGAFFNPHNRRITVFPKLDTFSTMVAVAKGNFQSVVGPTLAHEATHAHQTYEQKALDAVEAVRQARLIQQKDPELLLFEAIQLQGRSRDLAIIQESQAYIVEYMITGGDVNVDKKEISAAMSILKEALDKKSNQKLTEFIEKLGVNEEKLQQFSEKVSENGFPSILDSVSGQVKYYLPKRGQGNEDYLSRIPSATLQMLRLLDNGVSHRQIADLLRDNFDSIHAGKEWDEGSQKYKFLQLAIEQHPNQEQIDDAALLAKFNKQMENRVMKIRAIATEELTRNKTTGSH